MRQEHPLRIAARTDHADANRAGFDGSWPRTDFNFYPSLKLALRVVLQNDADVRLFRFAADQLIGALALFNREAVRDESLDIDAICGDKIEESFYVPILSPAHVS